MAGKNIGLVLQCQSLLYVTRWHASIPADKSYCDHSIIYQYNFTAQSSYVCHSYSHWVSKSLMSLPRHTFLEQSSSLPRFVSVFCSKLNFTCNCISWSSHRMGSEMSTKLGPEQHLSISMRLLRLKSCYSEICSKFRFQQSELQHVLFS